MTPETCGVMGKRAQVLLVWVKAPSDLQSFVFHSRKHRVTGIWPQAMHSLWHTNYRMFMNTSIGGVKLGDSAI